MNILSFLNTINQEYLIIISTVIGTLLGFVLSICNAWVNRIYEYKQILRQLTYYFYEIEYFLRKYDIEKFINQYNRILKTEYNLTDEVLNQSQEYLIKTIKEQLKEDSSDNIKKLKKDYEKIIIKLATRNPKLAYSLSSKFTCFERLGSLSKALLSFDKIVKTNEEKKFFDYIKNQIEMFSVKNELKDIKDDILKIHRKAYLLKWIILNYQYKRQEKWQEKSLNKSVNEFVDFILQKVDSSPVK